MIAVRKILERPQERRRHQRVKIALLGRYMLEDYREFPCQTLDMSPGGLALFVPVKGALGEKVVAYLDQLGRVQGVIVRQFDNGFALQLTMSQVKREKLAEQLTWLANRHALGMPEDRRHERLVPSNPRTTLKLGDGREYMVKMIDFSVSGCAVLCDSKPPINTLVTIGNTPGRVVRVFEAGVALEFIKMFAPEQFDANITL